MKKILNMFILVLFTSFVLIINVRAASLAPTNPVINVGKNVEFTITVVQGNEYKLAFDESLLEVDGNHNCGNRSEITSDCKIKLKAKADLSLTSDKEVVVTLSENADNDAQKSSTVTIKANKTTTTTATSSQGKSNNANLKSIEVLTNDNEKVELTPAFASNIYEYSAEVPASVKTIIVTPTIEDSKSNAIISDNVNDELKSGENNKITIKVTAEDGTAKLYTLNIKRGALSADPELSSLTIKESKNFKFVPEKHTYNVKVDNSVKSLTIIAEPKEESTIVDIEGNENLENGSKIKIRVTAEDGTARLYTLVIIKNEDTTDGATAVAAAKNPLIIAGLSLVGIILIGGIIYVIKK